MKICHIITGLSTGGAEMMLYKLLSAADRSRFTPVVISLMDYGTLGKRIKALDVPIYTLDMVPGRSTPAALWRLIRLVRQLHPNLIQGWMYHGNIAALLAGVVASENVPVLWNIRQSLYSLKNEKRLTAFIIRLGALFSSRPVHIIYNSRLSAHQHELLGYASDRTQIIPNGFDCNRFRPSEAARLKIRNLLGLKKSAFLIGLIARWHPMKDHSNFIHAAELMETRGHDVYFVLAGRGVDKNNSNLMKIIQEKGLTDKMYLLGERTDVPSLMAGLDIVSSSSAWGEGFPNVVGEAMACGIPCVVTDVGDSAWVVGNTGIVIPPRDPEALANAWKWLIDLGRAGRIKLGRAARERVLEKFSLAQVVENYEQLYLKYSN